MGDGDNNNIVNKTIKIANNNGMRRIKDGGRGRCVGSCYNNNNHLRSPTFHCGWIEMRSSSPSSLYNNNNNNNNNSNSNNNNNNNNDDDDNNNDTNIPSTTTIFNNNLISNYNFLKPSTYVSNSQACQK